MKLMIANRGEIAIRIARAAADLDIPSVAVFSEDDARSLHVKQSDQAFALSGAGTQAYLDIDQLIAAAQETGCDAVHPGYGFVSENAAFAERCAAAGITFVGPRPETLALFGNKVRAREFAAQEGVPIVRGISQAIDLDAALKFLGELPAGTPAVLKAVGGGGGRGMRIVRDKDSLSDAFARAQSEAEVAFGSGALYIEQLIENARHVEVQVAGDAFGNVCYLGNRDCTLQRRHQKLIEVAPAPGLDEAIAEALADASVRLARTAAYQSLGTFEFLVAGTDFYFIEANARLQVEHTVTETVTGVDLVQLQIQIAQGASIAEMRTPSPNGVAIQARVNLETMTPDGTAKPSGGTLVAFDLPSGPGVRTDTCGYTGFSTNPHYDSLLAKVIAHGPTFEGAAKRSFRALAGFRVEGVNTNIAFLQALLADANFRNSTVHTRYVDEHVASLVELSATHERGAARATDGQPAQAGVKLATNDPLAVLEHGKTGAFSAPASEPATITDTAPVPDGTVAMRAPMQGTIVSIELSEGEEVLPNHLVLVMGAMKMEHEIRSDVSGSIHSFNVNVGDTVYEGHALAFIEEREVDIEADGDATKVDLDHVRPDLAEVHARHAITLDDARPDAVEKRRRTHQRTARENIDDLCDPETFLEHGQLVLTPGTGLPADEVIRKFSTDGMVTGIGSVNGDLFPTETARTVVMSYDYTVLAGTQGAINHPKTDRMLELAAKWRRPVVFFTEGGGGRAGTGGNRQKDQSTKREPTKPTIEGAGRPLDTPTFATMGRLSGLVPLVGITSRYCFAGNASLLGCCDVIIATEGSNIGMGGPALIEGGNLGVFRPEEVGPLDVQRANGVIDIVVKDEEEAVRVTKQYLSYFQGSIATWDSPDQRLLRNIVPENRLRIYSVREVIETMADTGTMLELRRDFGLGMVTAFIRIEGRPIGVLANNPQHLSGAIDSDGSDKAARFLQLCDAFDIPVLVLCDTPGMMVGPEIEKTALVRHCSRLFVTGANLTVPHVTIVLRKAYGLGAQAMAGGSFKEPLAVVAWPTGEFGGMGLEGQVKLGYRNELAMIDDPEERLQRYNDLVDAAYVRGRAMNAGVSFQVDDVIDPADSRHWVSSAFGSVPPPLPREGKKRRNVDTW